MLSQFNNQIKRIHTTAIARGAPYGDNPIINFLDFKWPNQVTTFEHYKMPSELLDYEYNYPVCRDTMGIRWPGYWFKRKFVYVQEMEPELVVPDLEGFNLKPYVSYRADDVEVPPLTAKELFDKVYAPQIKTQFEEGKLDKLELKPEDIDESRAKALRTGSDLFEEHTKDGVRAPMEWMV